MRELLHRGRLEDRAVAAEQERRFEVHQDARFGSPRVGDLLELLGPLVEVIADGAAGDPAHDGADGRSFTNRAAGRSGLRGWRSGCVDHRDADRMRETLCLRTRPRRGTAHAPASSMPARW